MALTAVARHGLEWYASGGAAGVEPPYAVMRAFITLGFVTPAGVITEEGRKQLDLDRLAEKGGA